MIVTVSQFNEYTGNFEDSESALELKTTILSAAQELVSEYLRFDPDEKWGESVPQLVRLTVLRIATLMLMEAGENIGVTGKSFSDNSRSFISYTNYAKYLNPLQTFREVAF
jgi:hypothetical protein